MPFNIVFLRPQIFGHIEKGVTEREVFACACQYIVSPRGRTSNRTVTQMQHPLLVEGRPNCARRSLASALSAPRVGATSYCDAGGHANVVTPMFAYPLFKRPQKLVSTKTLLLQGRKKYTPPPWRPSLFSFSGSEALWCIPFFPDLWCIPFSLVFPGK